MAAWSRVFRNHARTSYVKLNREESQGVSVLSWIMNSPGLGSSSVTYAGFIKERLRVISYILAYEAHAWFRKHVIKRRSDWPKVFEMRRGTAVSHHINCGILVLVWKPGTRGETELEV